MERKIYNVFLNWKKDVNKKLMLLYGPCGCGKTYSVLDFGNKEYKNVVYFDTYNNLELNYVVEKNLTIEKLIRGLAAVSLETIFPNDTLIVFDNVDKDLAIKLKKVFKGISNYHAIMITNRRSLVEELKGEEIIIKNMTYVSFPEYLKYLGKDQLIEFIIDSYKNNTAMPFHAMAQELFNDFLITGGHPEVIVNFESLKGELLNVSQRNNILLQKNLLLNLDNLIDIKRGIEVYDNVCFQLAKENKKFQYGLLRAGARSKEYESCIKYMIDNDVLLKCYKVGNLESPLSKHRDTESFKLYYTDSGILFKNFGIHYNKLYVDNRILYLLYENNIATTLKENGFNLYYYQSGGKSEIDFVVQTRTGKIYPIEIIRKDMAKSKSLKLVMNKYGIKEAFRIGDDNFSLKNGIKYIPFYALFCIAEGV